HRLQTRDAHREAPRLVQQARKLHGLAFAAALFEAAGEDENIWLHAVHSWSSLTGERFNTEATEITQRAQSLSLWPLCRLCVSVLKRAAPYIQPRVPFHLARVSATSPARRCTRVDSAQSRARPSALTTRVPRPRATSRVARRVHPSITLPAARANAPPANAAPARQIHACACAPHETRAHRAARLSARGAGPLHRLVALLPDFGALGRLP